MSFPRCSLSRSAASAVRRGHPWVYRDAVERPAKDLRSGSVVDLFEAKTLVGRGLWDASSPIAVRVFGRSADERLDEAAIVRRVERAFELRDELFGKGSADGTNAYRLLNGEGDRVPGLVIDRYGSVAVARTDGEAMARWLDRLTPHLSGLLSSRGIETLALRCDPDAQGRKLRTLHGPQAPDQIIVQEAGVTMEVDLARGQKTGAFLDQRDNRVRIRTLAASAERVLNLYSYAGGFSVSAALGGAREVTSVDSAAAAHATAQRNFRHNQLDPAKHQFVTADAQVFLERASVRGDRFDLIISDPPSFARSERNVPRALSAYRKLHGALAAVLREGGLLCAASCSSHVNLETFLSTLDDVALGRDDLRTRAVYGCAPDHPTLAAFPEGRYLKFVELT